MKSLEIVRDKLYILEKYPAKIETIKLEKDVLINQEQLLKIEQDLEVLEIFKKYIYYKEHEIKLKSIRKSIYDFDYEKLKQWLEENENE